MIRRLVEANFFENREKANAAQICFWLKEIHTPQSLIEVAQNNSKFARRFALKRPLLRFALAGQIEKLDAALSAEESAEREKDRLYWLPLRKELEQLRHSKIKNNMSAIQFGTDGWRAVIAENFSLEIDSFMWRLTLRG